MNDGKQRRPNTQICITSIVANLLEVFDEGSFLEKLLDQNIAGWFGIGSHRECVVLKWDLEIAANCFL